tara:strand:+ start:375 stop:617 length:243 start_codon:yes stop_codon:yes gene_type:complete
MDIKQDYREESNLDVYAEHSLNYANYTNEYVKWLEAKLTLTDVKQEVLEILNKYAIEYLGGTVSIDENDFDDLASEISDL